MAEVEEQQFTTLAERIAALNRQKNFQAPPSTIGKRAPPPPPGPIRTVTEPAGQTPAYNAVSAQKSPSIPPRPGRAAVDQAPPLPRRNTEQVPVSAELQLPSGRTLAPPPLVSRNSQQQGQAPSGLPSRRPSGQTVPGRRNSNSSDISYISTVSNLSLSDNQSTTTRRLPPPLEQAKLPPLPPTRRELEAARRVSEDEVKSPSLPPRTSTARGTDSPTPSLPPRLPSRPAKSPTVPQGEERSPALPVRRLPPPPTNYQPRPALENGFNRGSRNDAPPPVPVTSRPSAAQIDAIASKAAATRSLSTPSPDSCLICRDYSGPDRVAAQYPVSSLPRQGTVDYLAHVLCDPFPSHTDKARAIFAWCHHNIAYDVAGFFGGCIPRGQSPSESIFTGKAVCEGYARIYEAIALRARLECTVVGGHGKGFSYKPLGPGERPPPPNPTGHAWNAVRIDGGKWKVIDPCWGAGAVSGSEYIKCFKPQQFWMTNEQIGAGHFPSNPAHFFREDGRIPTWEEYILGGCDGEPAMWYGRGTEEGLSEFTFEPRAKRISVWEGSKVIRFQFSKLCEHWTPERNGPGKQMLFVISIHGAGGNKEDLVTLDNDGFWWWADIRAADLGRPGQTVSMFGFEKIGDVDARGVTKEEWLRKKGRVGYNMCGIALWELV
ncbi:hypothetical protein B0H67DRAFT_554152 [Lasiosphaeris hirsuta]|uniref:Transglutaminase-like domain-containing protein n=1 Tax=Lasiosphaeris hirsuta TaxID=260670 RepID=A0AA40AH09_9PEZI|nr:hypothetical protein B0H67DRAFT_554152 [Lasiosphaeris hirsuta]